MKKKLFAALLVLTALLPGCSRKMTLSASPVPEMESVIQVAKGSELYCLVDTEEKAKEIAKLYGIELVEFSVGVATFHTEQDPNEVIRRGKENGWPELAINQIMHLD